MRSKGISRRALLEAILLSILLLSWIGCRDEGSIHPFEPTALPETFLHSFTASPTMLPLGGREAQVVALVVDTDGNALEGVAVIFSTDLGTVQDSAQTDSMGMAYAIFTSGSEKGTATVTASIGSFQLDASIIIGANELSVGSSSSVADGRSKVDVSARVFRRNGMPAQTVMVTFSATAGDIPKSAVTDSSGWVWVQITAPASNTDVEAEITATVETADLGEMVDPGDGAVETEIIGVASITFRGITLTLTTKESEIVASGMDTTKVYCLVAETETSVPVKNLDVNFGTNLGAINSTQKTDENGTATVELKSGIYAGTATLIAYVDELTDTTTVELTPLKFLDLKATPRNIITNGEESVISTSLLNQNNNPVPNMEIHFETDMGIIPEIGVTDETGAVAVSLISGDSTGTATVHAWFGSLSVYTTVQIGVVVEEPIRLTPLDFDPEVIVADGISQSRVTTRLLNESNNPVIEQEIQFATTLGVITESALTDSSGIAEAWLTSVESEDTLTSYVTATHGSLSVNGSVDFYPLGTKIPVSLTIANGSSGIQVVGLEGMESTILTAIAYDESGNKIEEGWDVTFTILSGPDAGEYLTWPDSGSGDAVTVPITDSTANIVLTSGTKNGVIGVSAETEGGIFASVSVTVNAGPPAHAVIGIDTLDAVDMEGGLYDWKVTIAITDAYANPVSDSTPVFLTLHDDSCGSGVVPANMQISGWVLTGNSVPCNSAIPEPGLTRACLLAPHREFEDFPSFALEVRAGADTTLDCLRVNHSGQSAQPHSIVLISVEDSSLAVSGVGANSTSRIEFEVRDVMGRPLRDGNATGVEFDILTGPSGVSLSRSTDTTNSDGHVSTTVQSGTVAGVVKIRASIGSIQSNVVSLAIHGGPPDAEHFSIAAATMNLAGMIMLGLQDSITAFVYDQYANPVPQGTAVYFTTEFGGILGSAVTNEIGQASSVLYSAAPLPTCLDDGLVEVTATTIDGSNLEIEATTEVLFSGSTVIAIDPPTFTVENGSYVDLMVFVGDECGNPLVSLSTVTITSSGGVLVGNVYVEIPDTKSVGYTQIWVRITDDAAEETAPPASHSVTVQVDSQNGSAAATIFGTID